MDIFLQWIVDHAAAEMGVIAGAPISFALVMIVIWLVAYFFIKRDFAGRIESHETRATTQQAHIDQKTALADEYRERMDGATPKEVQEEISSLKAQVAKLSAKPSDREISHWQLGAFGVAVAELQAREGSIVTHQCGFVSAAGGDPESRRYARKILKMFERAQLVVGDGPPADPERDDREIIVIHSDNPRATQMANEYVALFIAAEIPAVARVAEPDRWNGPNVDIVVAPQREVD
jgi:hypothetical protein